MLVRSITVGFAAVLVSGLLLTETTLAITLTNRDERDHKVAVTEGDKRSEHVVKPGGELTGICEKGCIIRLDDNAGDDQDYELEGTETVAIEEGLLYYEGPDAPDALPPSTPSPTAPPAKSGPPPVLKN